MEILAGPEGVPQILLGRPYDADGGLSAAEAAGAWSAWKKAAPSLAPQSVLRLIDQSGLVGRGGAGHPTATKWRTAVRQPAEVRYVIANGFEADPGAQLDRTLMERDPHAIVEGLAFACYAVGARQAYIAVGAAHTLAQRRLDAAVRAAEEAGYVGSDALGTGFDIHIEVLPIEGGFVVGEETVLLRAIENKRAQPEQRPPYPAERGLWGRPTVVNNVETLAAVPWIVANGTAAFAAAGGADGHAGTTLVQVSGAVARPGIAEIPLGLPLRGIIDDVFGGVRTGATIKAVLVGGPAGGFLPPSELAVAYSGGELEARGAIVGSGAIVVLDEATCLVDMATLLERFLSDESCGKTIPCRIGVRRLYEIGQRASSGLARPTDPRLLADLSADVRDGALCGLEYCAPNPFLSGMRYFAQEFEDHFARGTCPAGVCATGPRSATPTMRASA